VSISRLRGSVRCCRLGCVGRNCPQLCLLWEAVHPIRRHYTPSDRVYRDVTGASLRNGCIATDRVQRDVTGVAPLVRSRGEHVEAVWLRPMLPVGVCGEELSAVALVVGGGAPDP